MKDILIGKRFIGKDKPAYFIADIGANHDGSLERAKKLIFLCAKAGANAAKFQNFKADKIVSKYGFENLKSKLSHQAKWHKPVYEVYRKASINPDWTPILKETCDKAGIDYLVSPYDFESVDSVEPYVCGYKIGSGDITWVEIIEYIAKKCKPVFLATGASSMADVKRAVAILRKNNVDIILMQCNTNYSGDKENLKHINLNVLSTYGRHFKNIILGLSDHTKGFVSVLGAVALGARVIEKHFTDDFNKEGPDHGFALAPKSWKEMVSKTRELESALGDGIKKVEENELETIIIQRRSLRARKEISAGKILCEDDLIPLRPIPKDGIAPYEANKVLGRKIKRPLKAGEHLTWEDI